MGLRPEILSQQAQPKRLPGTQLPTQQARPFPSTDELSWTTGKLSSMALVGGLSLGPVSERSAAINAEVSAAWLAKGTTSLELFRRMMERATDFSWLKNGDTVLVKLTLNSGYKYPMTSDPWSLECLLKVLREHGARKIFVGDQPSARHVVRTAEGYEKGSSRELARSAGLLEVIERDGATPVFFEERGYGAYLEALPAGEHHWPRPMQMTSFVKEVDHIIYLPRLGSHGLADFTSGMKIAVGFLREDSRRVLHQGGGNYYAMYQEINEVPEIKSRVRLAVTSGRLVLSLIGPDAGYIVEPECGPVFASENLLAHDAFAYAFLQYARQYLTPKDASDASIGPGTLWDVQKMRTSRNRGLLKLVWKLEEKDVPEMVVFQPGSIYQHPALMNYMRLNGSGEISFSVTEVNQCTDDRAREYVRQQLTV